MKSPVLFLIFKREDTTRRVFDRIREARPPRLYVAADGPRKDHPDEVEKCMKTRKIVENVDWPCEVHHLYRENNLGCGLGVSSAITWFFNHETQGIIIEDDILPHIDFFKYCDEMLDKYKDNKKVQLITGRNAFYNGFSFDYTYYFSSLFHIWGWASWKRVWDTYQFDVREISKEDFLKKLNKRKLPKHTIKYWETKFDIMQSHPIDTWDFQLFFNQIVYERYSIVPYINQTMNIGFNSADATHTQSANIKDANHLAFSALPIKHQKGIGTDKKADELFADNFGFVKRSFCNRIIHKLIRLLCFY